MTQQKDRPKRRELPHPPMSRRPLPFRFTDWAAI